MSIDRRDVDAIADLARLELTDEEADRLTVEMNQILEHAMHLRRSASTDVDGANGEASAGITGIRGAGVSGPDPLLKPLESFAPHVQGGFFVVPPPPGVSGADEPGSVDDA